MLPLYSCTAVSWPPTPFVSTASAQELDAQCRVQRRLEPGEILFCNNHVTAHARTAFEDGGAAEGRQGRLLVRTWITYDQSRLAEAGQRK
jgi:hypothetical protein